MEDDIEEGVAESSGPSPRAAAAAAGLGSGGGGGGGSVHGSPDIRNVIYERLVAIRNEEAISNPSSFRVELDRHFLRLPER
jgi:hypothetical protein